MPRKRKTDRRKPGQPGRRKLRVERLEDRAMLAGTPELVLDINAVGLGSDPSAFVEAGRFAYFTANDGINGRELWRTDGTHAGTKLVFETSTGINGRIIGNLTNLGGLLYFTVGGFVGSAPSALWRTDGTAAGTQQISPTGGVSVDRLVNVGGVLYFAGSSSNSGVELWKSDGTTAGTTLIKNIYPQGSSNPWSFANADGVLYFFANDGVTGNELWRSDGSEAGTVLVKDIDPVTRFFGTPPNTSRITNVNGSLYFAANDGVNGWELWKSDGTDAGTVRVKDIRIGGDSSSPTNLTNVAGTLYFTANDGVNGYELWKSDGTEIGTVIVKDVAAGASGSPQMDFVAANDKLFFVVSNALWRSDGTESGTVRVASAAFSSSFTPRTPVNVGGTLYFSGSRAELWSVAPGADTAQLVRSFSTPATNFPTNLSNVGGRLFFSANDGGAGLEPWVSDGTAAGTRMIRNVQPGPGGSGIGVNTGFWTLRGQIMASANVNGELFFTANDGVNGDEVWKSNGLAEGTKLVKNIGSGRYGSVPRFPTNVNGTVYFNGGGLGSENLWKSDSTEAGTVRIPGSIRSGSSLIPVPLDPYELTNVNGTLFFRRAGDGNELWKSDGTSTGTMLVKRLTGGPGYLTNVGGKLFFYSGGAIWRSDGTDAGTIQLAPPAQTSGLNRLGTSQIVNVNGSAFFHYGDLATGAELWKSDGTVAGTVRVKDIARGTRGSLPSALTNVNGTLYFSANDGTSGYELWKSDGTETGTVRVWDIYNSGSSSSFPRNLINVSGTLYFSTGTGVTDNSLWKSNGTEAGTVRVRDFTSSGSNSSVRILTNAGGNLFFTATDGLTGLELWKSDGTQAGTQPVRLAGNRSLQSPTQIVAVHDRLFVVGTLPEVGQELFTQVLIDPPAVAGDYDRNGRVELADFDIWSQTNGSATKLRADGNGDGRVDQLDYAIWRQNYRVAPPRRPDFRPLGPVAPVAPGGEPLVPRASFAAPSSRQAFTPTRRADLLLVATPQFPVTTPTEAAPLRTTPPSEADSARTRAIDEALAALFVKDDD
ncbi:MAG: ELWxxDGT repeat protein [Lacipirellulaceae bacterium]